MRTVRARPKKAEARGRRSDELAGAVDGEGKGKEAVALDQRSSAGIGPWARASVRPGWTNGPLGAPGEKNSPGETMPPLLGVV